MHFVIISVKMFSDAFCDYFGMVSDAFCDYFSIFFNAFCDYFGDSAAAF